MPNMSLYHQLKARDEQYNNETKRILDSCKWKLDGIVNILLNGAHKIDWKYMLCGENDNIIFNGYIYLNEGDTVVDDGISIEITAANVNSYLKHIRLYIPYDMFELDSVETIAAHLKDIMDGDTELDKTELNKLIQSKPRVKH